MTSKEFDTEFAVRIYPDSKSYSSNWHELWQYRDFILLMVRRDFVANYKQTILGPAWAVLQPVVMTLIFAVIFGDLAGLSPDGVPVFLFYMSGQVTWTFFSSCVTSSANTFVDNAHLMGKVYFPRFAMPISNMLSNCISLAIQIVLFAGFYVAYVIGGTGVHMNITALLIPLYILHIAVLAVGAGSLLSALTTKYRDLVILISYGVLMWMYISPVIYDAAIIPGRFMWLYMLNPVSPVIMQLRYAIFDQGSIYPVFYCISIAVTIIIFIAGNHTFNRVERTFLDTI